MYIYKLNIKFGALAGLVNILRYCVGANAIA